MKARFQLSNPKAAEMTLQMTMSLEAWEKLKSQFEASPVSNNWPAWEFIELTRELIKSGNQYITGCNQVLIVPPVDKDGKLVDPI